MNSKIIDFQNSKLFRNRQKTSDVKVPVYSQRISAGTPSYVDDHVENVISFNDLIFDSLKYSSPENIAICTISGNSMETLLHDKQQIIIDSALPYMLSQNELNGKIIVASVYGDSTIKRLQIDNKYFYLVPENKDYKTIRKEFSFKSFKRSFNLDDKINTAGIQAKYENGVLKLYLPKKEEAAAAPQQISIN